MTPGDDIIDTRDIIERIAELETIVEEDPEDEDAADELTMLTDFAENFADSIPDWKYGEVMILDGYFEDYARQMAEDIGAIDRDAGWPCGYIDWEAAANALQMDYTDVQLDGFTYWVR